MKTNLNNSDVTPDVIISRTMDAKTIRAQITEKIGLPPNLESLGYNINKEQSRQFHELRSGGGMGHALRRMAEFMDRAGLETGYYDYKEPCT